MRSSIGLAAGTEQFTYRDLLERREAVRKKFERGTLEAPIEPGGACFGVSVPQCRKVRWARVWAHLGLCRAGGPPRFACLSAGYLATVNPAGNRPSRGVTALPSVPTTRRNDHAPTGRRPRRTDLRENVPEFEDHYRDLEDIYDEDLTPQVVFNELADFVTELLQHGDREDTLERCFAAVELVAVEPGADGTGLVAFCFLDQLAPFALEMARSYLEPITETILELVDQDLLYEDDGETALLACDRPSRAASPNCATARVVLRPGSDRRFVLASLAAPDATSAEAPFTRWSGPAVLPARAASLLT